MSNNEQNRNSKYTSDRYQSEKSYNGVEPTDTQVLAPFVIRDKTMLVNKDVNQDNLKTFNIYGKRILVGFVPVERAEFANALRVFNMDTNERILYFCVSSLGGALLIFVGLIYMVLKGNADKPQ